MDKFKIKTIFDIEEILSDIDSALSKTEPSYICVIDGNALANAHYDSQYRKILNNLLLNICDGKNIAFIASIIYKEKYSVHPGPDLFINLIEKKN